MPEKRRNQVHVYLSDEEAGMLSHVAITCGLTQADVIRQALRSAYQMRLGIEIAKRAQAKPQKGVVR